MEAKYEIDNLDRKILAALQADSRKPFLEMAKELQVSAGTIHVRFNKLKSAGIIKSSKFDINYEKLGLGISAFIGINLRSASDYKKVVDKLERLPQVSEAHYTTGQYSIFIKALLKDTNELHYFLTGKLQEITEIQSTETLIILNSPINRYILATKI